MRKGGGGGKSQLTGEVLVGVHLQGKDQLSPEDGWRGMESDI